jgi:RNA polymerase sigma-70 factor, ECF subfamily
VTSTRRVEDADLVAAVRAGEHRAFAELVGRHEASVRRLAHRLLGSTGDAEDVVQDAFVHAFVGIDRLRHPEAFGGWVHAIAANLARKARRSSRDLRLDDGSEVAASESGADVVADRDALTGALAELPVLQREAMVGYLAGFSYAELAARAGVPLSTVRGRMFQGRLRLRASLRPPPSPARKDSRRMELIRVTPAVYGAFRRSTDRVLVLAEASGRRQLGVRLSAVDAAAVETVLVGSELPGESAASDFALGLLRAVEARVERVTVRDVAGGDDSGYYATLELATSAGRREVVAAVAAAVSLAVEEDAPVVVPEDVLARRGWDPTDPTVRRRLDRAAVRKVRELIESGRMPATVPTPILSSEAQRLLDGALRRLLEQPVVRTVALTHRSGALQAWRGLGDAELLERYAAVQDGEDDDLAELATNAAFPSEYVVGGIRFETLATDWRLHVALAEDRPPDQWQELDDALAALHAELEPALGAEEVKRS